MTAPDLGSGDFSGLATENTSGSAPQVNGNGTSEEVWTPPEELSNVLPGAPPAPPEPQTLEKTLLTGSQVESLLLKGLLDLGNATGAELAAYICLSRPIIGEALNALRDELMVSIKASAGVHDFVYQLTDAGFQRARRYAQQCNYVGAAPVTLATYEAAIRRQSISKTRLTLQRLQASLEDMTLKEVFVSQIAQAINDGRGMFLYGSPGNGKTTLAERLCDAFGQYIWIPQMISIRGDLVRLYDPNCHELADAPQLKESKYDRRWVLIRRPTVVVGGELTLEQLDTRYNDAAGVSEAPVQMKANGGTLLIDDFGRQRVSSTEILNRLIVPLEKQYDFLNLASGRQIQTPFDLLFILSTNLEPRELVDEAFLRRIPYKIEVNDPDEQEYRKLFQMLTDKMGYELAPGVIDDLIAQHYTAAQRPLRFCQPRDLLRQIKNYCEVHELPQLVNSQAMEVAVHNYFAGL